MNTTVSADRSKIQVLDCTVRDGGLVNDHRFDDDLVGAVYRTCAASGVDCMEIGYKAAQCLATGHDGAWRFCTEDDIRRIVGDNPTALKLSVMADAGKTDWHSDILPKRQSVLDMIRVAFYIDQLDEAVDMMTDAAEKGYEVSANLMAISNVPEAQVDRALEVLATSAAQTIVVVDSNGSLYPDQAAHLVRKYRKAVAGTDKQIGMHAHNNMQLAFANTIEAIKEGVTRVDATMAGLGRGAGNCAMELLLSYLHNPRFDLRPVLQLLETHFVHLRQTIEWGPLVPYNITGALNLHPRAAIETRAGSARDRYVDFYDQCIAASNGHGGENLTQTATPQPAKQTPRM